MRFHPQARTTGFALVIALSLMAFIVLLLLSITTLVQIESKTAGNSLAATKARQNALLALNIAIGELQKNTGPDQRITATASIKEKFGTPVSQPHWVGVYGNAQVADYNLRPDQIQPSEPILLNWLVSGNEGVQYAFAASGSEFGQITSPPLELRYEPTDTVSDLTTVNAKSEIQIANVDAALLVGPNSTDDTQAAQNFVVAPMVEINSDVGPGGRYAWWVGDEGVKAKANLRPGYLEGEAAEASIYQGYAFLNAQRSALEVITYDDSGNVIGTDFDFTDPALAKVQDLDGIAFLGGTGTSPFEDLAKNRFHDLTAHGHGVLSDPFVGGLKKDLSADFNGASSRPASEASIFPPLQSGDAIPTWGKARSLVNPNINYAAGNSGLLIPNANPVLPSETENGLYPVFSMASLGFDFYVTGPFSAGGLDSDDVYFQVQAAIIPAVVLWNPHSVAINPTNYEVGLRIHGEQGKSQVWIDISSNSGSPPNESDQADVLNLHTGSWESDASANNNFLRFRLEGEEIAPGESQLYSLPTNGEVYEPGTSTLRISDEDVDNIINHATYTSLNLRIDASGPPDANGFYDLPQIRVGSQTTLASDNRQWFDLVLAEEGGLSNLTDQSQWYTSVQDARLYHRGDRRDDSRAFGGEANIWLDPDDYFNDLNQLVLSPDFVSGENISVYRMLMPMERRGSVSNNWFVGAFMEKHDNAGGRLRWLVTGNPRAPVVRNTSVENNVTLAGNSLFGAIHFSNGLSDSRAGDDLFFPFTNSTNGSRLSAGRGQAGGTQNYGIAVLFDHLDTTEQFVSLGQLQHSLYGEYGFYPSYSFGNSWADVRIPRDQHYRPNLFSGSYEPSQSQTLYDLSWHLNRAVWDRYFVSTVPTDWSTSDIEVKKPLPNNRMSYYKTPETDSIRGDDAYDEAAANLWVNGAFNINSTSEQAWRALLSATLGIPETAVTGGRSFGDSGDNVDEIAPIPRFVRNQGQVGHNNTNFRNSMKSQVSSGALNFNYIGNRGLRTSYNGAFNGEVNEIVAELARTIVNEVKLRGPFLSLGDFVNRAIIEQSSDSDSIGIKSTLQAAIDKMGMDENGNDTQAPRIHTRQWVADQGTRDRDGVRAMVGNEWIVEHFLGGPDKGSSESAGDEMPYASTVIGSPSTLSPADLLTVIGPAISARSDVFRIRTYGESLNPITRETESRAWCEAIVQRLPDYVDPSDLPDVDPVALSSSLNTQFGRKYKILSFRWLDASEI